MPRRSKREKRSRRAASRASFDDWLEDDELGSDGLDNAGRVEALSGCFSFVLKPDGRPFQELYDIGTLTPIPEWQAMYDKVKQEAIDAGLPL